MDMNPEGMIFECQWDECDECDEYRFQIVLCETG